MSLMCRLKVLACFAGRPLTIKIPIRLSEEDTSVKNRNFRLRMSHQRGSTRQPRTISALVIRSNICNAPPAIALRRRDGKAISQLHCAAFASLHSLDQRTGHPEYRFPSCADGLRRLLASCCSLLSSAQPQALRLRKWKTV
jgi:hypothetical protein